MSLFFFYFFFQIILVYCMTGINSQLGPPSPRFAIPAGALVSNVRQPIQYRNERLVSGISPNGPFLRARRPVLTGPARANTLHPFPTPNSFDDDAKPVTEENESAETPSFLSQQQQPQQQQYIPHIQTLQQHQQPKLPSVLYTTDENGQVLEQNRPHIEFSTTPRFVPQTIPDILPTTLRTTGNAQRFNVNHDHPVHSALQGTTKPPVSQTEKFNENF